MGVPFIKIIKEVEAAVRLHGADNLDEMKRSCNLAYYELCGHASWLQLRRKVSINFTSKDSNNAMLLPGDLAGIDAVWDSDREYFPSGWGRSENDASESDISYRWFYTEPASDALAILSSIRMNVGASTFTGGTWDASYIGEYMQVAAELGSYKLTGTRTFEPRWYGPRLGGAAADSYLQIRPPGTKRFSIVNDEGDFEANTVTVYYWVLPPPLYQDHQPIMLPDHRALELLTIIRVLGLKDRKETIADRYRAEYSDALAKMENMNPNFVAPSQMKDRYGEGLRFTRVR